DALRLGRGPRNAEIVAKLVALGVEVTLAEVEAEAGGDVVARPHFARVLVRKGVVATFQDAFDRYLAKGAPAYVDRVRRQLPDALAAIRAAGGAAVLCHPFTLGIEDRAALLAELVRLRTAGVDAVEVRYGRYSAKDEREWAELAAAAGLLPSGGSDFHGENKP